MSRPRSDPRLVRPSPLPGLVLAAVLTLAFGACSAGDDGVARPPDPVATAPGTSIETEGTTPGTTEPGPLAGELVATLALTDAEAQCVIDHTKGRLDDAAIRALLAAPGSASPDRGALDEALGACGLAPATDTTVALVEGQPATYGDDPELDALWDRCSAEGTAVCDELYNRAPAGSDYEAFANTCGSRGPAQVACAPDANAGVNPAGGNNPGDPEVYGDSAALDLLWDQCAAGDGQACGALEFQAPAGSAYADFGASCGNRPGDPACATAG